jgi:hypothetical protein
LKNKKSDKKMRNTVKGREHKKNMKSSAKNNKHMTNGDSFNFGARWLKIILISLISFFVFVTLFMLFIYLSYGDDVLSVTKINATINVDDYIGFNLDKDKLHFGTAFPGGKSMRELSIKSKESGYIYATVDSYFKDWTFVSIQNEYIEKGTDVPFQITMFVPKNTPVGNYTFEIKIFVLEKKADFITKSILKSTPANYNLENIENEGSGKVILNVVNASANY